MTGINTNKNILPLAGPVNQSTYEITKISRNVKFMQKCNERLVFRPFLIHMIQNINAETHFVPVGTCWPQELPVKHTVVTINDKNTLEK